MRIKRTKKHNQKPGFKSLEKRYSLLLNERKQLIVRLEELKMKKIIVLNQINVLKSERETLKYKISQIKLSEKHDKISKDLLAKYKKNKFLIYGLNQEVSQMRKAVANKKKIIKHLDRTIASVEIKIENQWSIQKFRMNNTDTIELIINKG